MNTLTIVDYDPATHESGEINEHFVLNGNSYSGSAELRDGIEGQELMDSLAARRNMLEMVGATDIYFFCL